MLDIFNNREIAIAIWGAVFLTWTIYRLKIEDLYSNLLKRLFNKHISILFISLALYTALSCYILNTLFLWDLSQLKATIYWFVGVSVISVIKLVKDHQNSSYFKELVLDNLKLIVLIEFVLTFYSFELWIELILTPILIIITLMMALSSSEEKYTSVNIVLEKITIFIGTVIIAYAIYMLITHFNEFAQIQTIYDFFTPILLSFTFVPFMLLLHRYIAFENLSARLLFIIKDERIRSYAKRKLLLSFYLHPQNMDLWISLNQNQDFKSKTDVENSITNLFEYLKEENNPPEIDTKDGWSPFSARYFLGDIGLKTGIYKNIYDDVWFASSPYVELGEGVLSDNIGFYIEGVKNAVKTLKLVYNNNNKDTFDESYKEFVETINALLQASISQNIPNSEYENKFNIEADIPVIIGPYKLNLTQEKWKNENGQTIAFTISLNRPNNI